MTSIEVIFAEETWPTGRQARATKYVGLVGPVCSRDRNLDELVGVGGGLGLVSGWVGGQVVSIPSQDPCGSPPPFACRVEPPGKVPPKGHLSTDMCRARQLVTFTGTMRPLMARRMQCNSCPPFPVASIKDPPSCRYYSLILCS